MIAQLARFTGVGLVGTFTHVIVALLASTFLPVPALGANFIGFCAAVSVSYFGHAKVTFKVAPNHISDLPRFIVSASLGLASSSLITWIVSDQLGRPVWVAMCFVGVIVPTFTYLMLRLWVFSSKRGNAEDILSGVGVSLFPVLLTLYGFWGRMLDHDVAWYLVATRNWLEGARLYVDIIEVNPPLNFYLTVPAILIADATGFGDQNAQYISFSILLFISLFWCWKIRENVEGITTGQRILFQLFIALAVVMPALGALTQRDHIFTVFLLPWLIGFLPSSKKPPIRSQIARAAFAGLGICLKPHFLIFPISVFLWQCWLKRSLRPLREPWLLAQGIIGLTYVSYVFFVHPEYFSDTIPLGALVYGSYGFSDKAVLGPIFSVPAKFVFISLLLALLSRNRPPSLGLFVVLTVAGLGTYLSQWKGYPYQLIPFYSVSILGLGWLVVAVPGWSPSRIAAVTTLFMICAVKLLLGPYHNAGTVLLGDRVRGQSSVTALTTDLFVGPAVAFYAGAEWSSRYPALWLVPGVVNNIDGTDCAVEVERCETLGHIAERTRRDFVSDLKTFKPEAIIVDNQPMYIIDKNFDWWTFMEPNPEFAKIMGNYRLEQSMERFDIWVLR